MLYPVYTKPPVTKPYILTRVSRVKHATIVPSILDRPTQYEIQLRPLTTYSTMIHHIIKPCIDTPRPLVNSRWALHCTCIGTRGNAFTGELVIFGIPLQIMVSLLEILQKKYQKELYYATDHIFVRELCKGTLDDAVLFTYLAQDVKFFTLSLRLIARAISLCTEPSAMLTIGKQLGSFASSEATYFKVTMAELRQKPEKLPPAMLASPCETFPKVQEFLDFLEGGMNSESYTEIVTIFYMFELVYLLWAQRNGSDEGATSNLAYKHKEWISLHLRPDFEKWVHFLASEVARVTTDPLEQKKSEDITRRVLQLEGGFFDVCYYYNKN